MKYRYVNCHLVHCSSALWMLAIICALCRLHIPYLSVVLVFTKWTHTHTHAHVNRQLCLMGIWVIASLILAIGPWPFHSCWHWHWSDPQTLTLVLAEHGLWGLIFQGISDSGHNLFAPTLQNMSCCHLYIFLAFHPLFFSTYFGFCSPK